MDEALQPSTLSEILDRTAQIYRRRFLVFLGIGAMPTVVLVLFGGGVGVLLYWLASGADSKTPVDGTAQAIGIVILVVLGLTVLGLFLGLTALESAAMNHAASRAFLGQTFNIRDSYKAAWKKGWRALGLYAAQTAAVWVLPVGTWGVMVALTAGLAAVAGSAGGFLVFVQLLLMLGLVAYGVWMSAMLSLGFPVCGVEGMGVAAGIRRSARLTKGTRWRIVVMYLLCYALNWILSMGLMIPLLILMALIPVMHGPAHSDAAGTFSVFVIYGSAFFVQVLTRPVYGIALVNFYFDQRIRLEAFDIEWMMARAGLVVPTDAQPAAEARPWAAAVAEAAAASQPESGQAEADTPESAAQRQTPQPEVSNQTAEGEAG